MSDYDSSARPPFRFTPQVGIIVAVVLLALVIPVVAISYYFREDPQKPNRPISTAPLQTSLESIADQTFGENFNQIDSERVIVLAASRADEMESRAEAFLEVVERAGATVVDISSKGENPTRRWSVMVPSEHAEPFRRALAGDEVDFSSKAGSPGEGTEVLSIELRLDETQGARVDP